MMAHEKRSAWIRVIPRAQAQGELAAAYEHIAADSGEPANILRVQSLDPGAMKAHVAFYRHIMFGASPLSRTLRESIAVVVSTVNRCHY